MKILLRVFWLIWIPFLSGLQVRGQELNLVYNGSFEEFKKPCNGFGELDASKGWFQFFGTTDFYNPFCPYEDNFLSVPQNINGFQHPKSGKCYAGFLIFCDGNKKDGFYKREYLHTKLLKRLIAGQEYKITFYISLAEASKVFSDHVSIGFSKDNHRLISKVHPDLLNVKNKVIAHLNKENQDTAKWQKIEFNYFAEGFEQYIIIGSFEGDISKKIYNKILKENLVNPRGNHCYYFIDDISLTPVNRAKNFQENKTSE